MSEYARVYHSVLDDAKFDGVRDDMRLFGAWTMLLVVADMAYPSPAFVPPTVPRSAFARLVEAGLVDELPAHRYRIHGLEAERSRRSDAARVGGLASGRSRSVERPLNTASPDPRTDLNLAKQSKAEQEHSTPDRADIEAFFVVRLRPPTPAQQTFMDAYVRAFDVTGPDRAARLIFANPDDPIGALKADLAEFRQERRTSAVAAEAPKPKPPRRASGFTGVNAEIAALLNAQYEKEAS